MGVRLPASAPARWSVPCAGDEVRDQVRVEDASEGLRAACLEEAFEHEAGLRQHRWRTDWLTHAPANDILLA
jgi:hypothetical protein